MKEAKNIRELLSGSDLSGIEVSLTDLLENSKKSQKYMVKRTVADIKAEHVQNVLNMRTVQEGTAVAGAFCNRFMEIARNYKLNRVQARAISNIFQRIALDSKHNGASANGYKDLDWFKLAEYLYRREKNFTFEDVRRAVLQILDGKEVTSAPIARTERKRASFGVR